MISGGRQERALETPELHLDRVLRLEAVHQRRIEELGRHVFQDHVISEQAESQFADARQQRGLEQEGKIERPGSRGVDQDKPVNGRLRKTRGERRGDRSAHRQADQADWLRVGYFVGDLDFGGSRFKDFVADFGANWWNDNWTQITGGRRDQWGNVMVPLPLGQPEIWVAFWMNGQEGDYGLFDNICASGTEIVPERVTVTVATE